MANSTDYKVVFSAQDNISGTVKKVKNELDAVGKTAQSSTEKIDKQFNRIINSSAPLKRQLKDLQSLMAEMNFKGLSNTEQFTKIAAEAGRIKDAISDASAATQRFANDTMGLQAGIQVMQGFAAAGSIASGVMGLLGTKNEEVQRAILKVQSAMAILNGVQSIANVLNKDSILMHKIKSVQMQLSAAASAKETTATIANTAATTANTAVQKGWNVAKAIGKAMFGDFTGLLLLGAGAMLTYALVTSDATDAEKKRNEELQNANELAKHRGEVEQAMADKIASSAASQLASYYSLQAKWEECNGDVQKQQQFMSEYKGEIEKLGFKVNDLTAAENFFVKQTPNVVKAITARAQAQAAYEIMVDEMKNQLKRLNEKSVRSGAYYVVAHNIDDLSEEEKELARGKGWIKKPSTAGQGLLSKATAKEFITQEGIDQINARRNAHAGQIQRETTRSVESAIEGIRNTYTGIILSAQEEERNALSGTGFSSIRGGSTPTSSGGNRGGSHTGGSTTTSNKPTEPQALKDSLTDLQNQYNELKKNISKGLFKESEEKDLAKLKDLENKIQQKKIALGWEIDPEIKAKEELQKELDNISKQYGEIQLTPSFSSFEKATGKGSFDTSTLEGLQQQMDFNDNLINQYQSIIDKYKELGETGSAAYNEVLNAMQGVINANDKYSEQATDIYNKQKQQEEYYKKIDSYSEGIARLGGAFSALSGATEDSTSAMLQYSAGVLNAIAEQLPMIMKLFAAKKGMSLANIIENATELHPFPVALAAMVAGIASVTAAFASIPKFAEGGIVGGGSTHGDPIITRLNAGEMVLNGKQQRNLFNMINDGNFGFGSSNISFRIKGSDLYGTLRNYSKTQSKVGKTTGIR